VAHLLRLLSDARSDGRGSGSDPLDVARKALERRGLEWETVDREAAGEMAAVADVALKDADDGLAEG
jgi:hypothetical protein